MGLIVRQAQRAGAEAERVDIAIEDGVITAVGSGLEHTAEVEIDAGGRLVTAPFVDSHFHLDAVLTAGTPRRNVSGTLLEGIALWGELQPLLTHEGVKERAREYLRWCVSQGILFLRSHVDICQESLVAVRALVELRDELRGVIDVQLVAFPQHGLLRFPGAVRLLDEALDLGLDIVGGIPHYERSREAGVHSIRLLMERAERRGLPVDMHCDETDDPLSRFVEVLAEETVARDMQGRVTGSHLTSLHSVDSAYFAKLLALLGDAELMVISNPLLNMITQARADTYPKRRGLTRVRELMAAGINVSFGHDCTLDPWYPLGAADMLEVASMGLHACQMSGEHEIGLMFDAVTSHGARTLRLAGYGLEPGCAGDLVVLDAFSVADALRTRPARLAVVRAGEVVARTAAPERAVLGAGLSGPVDFVQPAFQ
ncbi:MAG TPA: cytosine deaminase [Solirubrobacteraceae bacterium]|jgi:cytosine deaminase|nr:cytosine deaminase [Solirubrobacteraceae bacterium]